MFISMYLFFFSFFKCNDQQTPYFNIFLCNDQKKHLIYFFYKASLQVARDEVLYIVCCFVNPSIFPLDWLFLNIYPLILLLDNVILEAIGNYDWFQAMDKGVRRRSALIAQWENRIQQTTDTWVGIYERFVHSEHSGQTSWKYSDRSRSDIFHYTYEYNFIKWYKSHE